MSYGSLIKSSEAQLPTFVKAKYPYNSIAYQIPKTFGQIISIDMHGIKFLLRGQVDGIIARVLDDTSASHTFISKTFVPENNLSISPHEGNVDLGDGSKIRILGTTIGDLRIQQYHESLDFQVIELIQRKLKLLKNWSTPQDVGQVKSFVGLANYSRKFVQVFSVMVAHLTELTKKKFPWNWTKACEKA
jgi:hypothetical protein